MGGVQCVANLPRDVPMRYVQISRTELREELRGSESHPGESPPRNTARCTRLRPSVVAGGSVLVDTPAGDQWKHDIARIDMQSTIGRGGFGQVYSGIRLSDQLPLAVKLVKLSFEDHDRLLRKLMELRSLRHLHLVTVFDCWSTLKMPATEQGKECILGQKASGVPSRHSALHINYDKLSTKMQTRYHESCCVCPSSTRLCEEESNSEATALNPGADSLLSRMDFAVAYIIQERCMGDDLLNFLKKMYDKVLPGEEATRAIILRVLSGLECLHKANWIHGDLKLENVMFARKDNELNSLRLIDLDSCHKHLPVSPHGLSILKEGENHHTVEYAAPELLEGHISPASDMRAVGCICYAMTEGELPYFEDDEAKASYMFIKGRGGAYSAECLDFMQFLLAEDISRRCPHATAALQHAWLKREVVLSLPADVLFQ